MEDVYQAAALAAQASASKNALCELELRRPVVGTVPQDPAPENSALRGLLFAVPMSLSLWGILGLLVWAIAR